MVPKESTEEGEQVNRRAKERRYKRRSHHQVDQAVKLETAKILNEVSDAKPTKKQVAAMRLDGYELVERHTREGVRWSWRRRGQVSRGAR